MKLVFQAWLDNGGEKANKTITRQFPILLYVLYGLYGLPR